MITLYQDPEFSPSSGTVEITDSEARFVFDMLKERADLEDNLLHVLGILDLRPDFEGRYS